MAYNIGDTGIDQQISDLVAAGSENPHPELIAEIITTALKLHRDRAGKGDLKMINTALKELRFSSQLFARNRHKPKVTMYGSARLNADSPNYQLAKEFAALMVGEGWEVITGAGPGIMEAGNEGAGAENSYGVAIRLPFETSANPYIDPNRLVNFKYFFTRKVGFVKESHAFVLFPGGFGTMDEGFELLTLLQTGKSDLHPVVLLDAPGSGYWEGWAKFIDAHLIGTGMVSAEDVALYKITNDPKEAAREVCHFYANYQSQRYVDGRLVIRMGAAPSAEQCVDLTVEFGDILKSGVIELVDASAAEIADEDSLDAERITLHFDRQHFARLRMLVDRLNDLVAPEHRSLPPAAFTQEQQSRPW
jgi:uncharacterized protein (TIGR00730 family)